MKISSCAIWLGAVCLWASQGVAQASESGNKTFLKFRNESALTHYLQQNPGSTRVHRGLMWVETSSISRGTFTESVQQSLGIDTVEEDHAGYRIPKPVVPEAMPANLPGAKLWGIKKIQSMTAWNSTQGSADVVVAVVDTGIDFNHPALRENIWINQAEKNGQPGVDDDGNGYVDDIHGADFISGKPTPLDDEGHGSHVAGTIAGRLPADEFYGVAPEARLMAVKTHNTKGEGSKASVVKGILYAADNGARVLNCSWGGAPEAGEYDQMLFDAIEYANKKGAVLIASAGNAAANNDTGMHFPSNYDLPGIISVASSTSTDTRSYFSNYGSRTVDLAAPGSNIWSVTAGGKSYEYLSGTSMASPHVSGAAALLASTPAGRSMSPAQIRETLMNNVEKLQDWSTRVISGGRLDVSFIGR
ncbi:MAG: S8 family peptidase [Silvanigrellaceae bacterium]